MSEEIRVKEKSKSGEFAEGIRDGIPIALGYFAVAFTLGIQAKAAGMSAVEATVMSLVNVTSAGEFAAVTIISGQESYLSLILSQFIINLRYMLMSFALSQKVEATLPVGHRMGIAFGVTDEIFGIAIGRKGKLSPFYSYGAMAVAIPGWTIGTGLGVILGSVLPEAVVSALGVALYGMFVAIIMPAAREDRHVAMAVVAGMAASYVCTKLPVIRDISAGSRIILLTVIISLAAALLFPVEEKEEVHQDAA